MGRGYPVPGQLEVLGSVVFPQRGPGGAPAKIVSDSWAFCTQETAFGEYSFIKWC